MSKKGKLNLVSAHIQLSAAYKVSPLEKMQVALEQTAAQKQEKRVAGTMLCRKLGVIPPRMMNENDDDDDDDEDNIPSQNWHRTVGMKVIAM